MKAFINDVGYICIYPEDETEQTKLQNWTTDFLDSEKRLPKILFHPEAIQSDKDWQLAKLSLAGYSETPPNKLKNNEN